MKKVQILIILLTLAFLQLPTAQAKGKTYEPIDLEVSKFVLDNGLTVIIHEDHKVPLVSVDVSYRVGSKNEPKGRRGFAHLFEHLLFNGSENFDTDFFKATEKLGATSVNGATSLDRTYYHETVPSNALDSVLWLESDRMGHVIGAISQAKLDEQRKVVLNEMKESQNRPYWGVIKFRMNEALFPAGHPYSWPTIGSEEDLNAASLEDVRQWFTDYYGPNNAILTLVGDVDTKEVLEKVKRYFGDIPASKKPLETATWVAKREENKRDVAFDRVSLPRIYKIWNVPGLANQEIDSLDFIARVLSSGKSSILYKDLVYEQKLASDVSAFIWGSKMSSMLFVSATAKPNVDLKVLEKALDASLQKIHKGKINKTLIESIKTDEYVGYMNSLEKTHGKASTLAWYEALTGDAKGYKKSFETFMKTDAKEMKRMANKWMRSGEYALEIYPLPKYAHAKSGVDRKKLPLSDKQLEVPFPKVEKVTLDNGITLAHIQRQSTPKIHGKIMFHGGSASDKTGKEGANSLLMDMLNEGTKSYDVFELENKLSALGAGAGGFSDTLHHGITFFSLEQTIEETLKVVKELILHPSFKQKEFDRIKIATLENFEKNKSKPKSVARNVFYQKLFGKDHPLGHRPMGYQNSVEKISRDDLVTLHKSLILENRPVIFTIGNLSSEQMKKKLDQAFSTWKPKSQNKQNIETSKNQTTTVYLINKKDAPQTAIRLGQRLPWATPLDNLYTKAVYDAFGNHFTSRLNMNLREDKGWSYGVRSGIFSLPRNAVFFAGGSVQSDKTVPAIKEIEKELRQINGRKPITQEEVTRDINRRILSLPGMWETNKSILNYAVDQYEKEYKDDFYQGYSDLLRKIDLQKVRAKAKETIDPAHMVWVFVGDLASIEAPIRKLNLGKVFVVNESGDLVK